MTIEKKRQIIRMKENGISMRQISDELGVSFRQVRRVIDNPPPDEYKPPVFNGVLPMGLQG